MSAVMPEIDNRSLEQQKNRVGAPSKYNTRTVRKAREYINGKYKTIPTIAGLCVYLGVCRDTLYTWLKHEDKKELSDTIALMPELREELLISGALKGEMNSNISKLILMTNHGYTDSSQSADAGIIVNVGRDKVQITHKNQTLTVESEE